MATNSTKTVVDHTFSVEKYLPLNLYNEITDVRINERKSLLAHSKKRKRRTSLTKDGKLVILATDHPGRRVTKMRNDPIGMGDRYEYLGRALRVITGEGIDGVMGTTDMIEDLLIVDYLHKKKSGKSLLDDKVVVGCMNRGGHAGSHFELEDRFTSFSAESIGDLNLDGGKMMYRFHPEDHGALITIDECAKAVTDLSKRDLNVFLEPASVEGREQGYAFKTDLDTLVKDLSAASALGATSLNMWLKISYNDNFARVARSTTLPILMLGGPAKDSPIDTIASFAKGMKAAHNVRGAMVGRNITFVQNDDPQAVAVALANVIHKGHSVDDAMQYIEKHRAEAMDEFTKFWK
jgi:DhnA family fructose-bisphosphate aldolase class Ia